MKRDANSQNASANPWLRLALVTGCLLAGFAAQAQTIKWGLTLTNINDPITPIVVTNAPGNTNGPGGVEAPTGSVSITAGGGDTYGNPDSFTYAYQLVTGDFDICVHLINVYSTDPAGQNSPKASLMVRASLDPGSYDFMINGLPTDPAARNGQIESIGRIILANDTDDLNGRGYNYAPNQLAEGGGSFTDGGDYQGDTTDNQFSTYPDFWVRIQRQGQKLVSYYKSSNPTDYGYQINPGSTNGWQILCVIHGDPTNFPNTLYVGLSTVAHNSNLNSPDIVTSTYDDYGPTPNPASNPSTNGVAVGANLMPGPFPNTRVLAGLFGAAVSADGMGYPPDTVQSNQSAPQQIIWNDGGFGGVARDIIATIPYETPGAFCFARYQCGAFDFQLSPGDPVAAVQNLGPYTIPARERFSTGNNNGSPATPAAVAWSPSADYGFAFTTVATNGAQWNDGSDPFYAATYIQIDPVASGAGYDMVGGHFRGGSFYTRSTKLVTGNIDPNSSGPGSGSLQRCAVPVSIGWFPYAQGWRAGYFDEAIPSFDDLSIALGTPVSYWKYGNGWGMHSGTALNGVPVVGNQATYNSPENLLTWISTYDQSGNNVFLAQLDFPGVNSLTDGMLFTIGNQENNSVRGPSAQNAAIPDGSGWYVAVRDIEAAKTDPASYAIPTTQPNSLAGSAFSFLYVPFNADNLVGGHIGTNGATIKGAGNFTVTHLGTGAYAITIPGKTGTNGVLLLQDTGYLAKQPAGFTPNGYSAVVDNSFLSYQFGGTNATANSFIVQAHTVVTNASGGEGVVVAQDAEFNFVYVDFQHPLAPPGTLPPVVSMKRLDATHLTVSWSNGPGFILQSTPSLAPGHVWTNLGTSNPVTFAPSSGPQFFRVVSP
jgi:hypothetical protein